MIFNQFYIEDAVADPRRGLVLIGSVTYGCIQVGMKCVNFLDREVRIAGIEVSNVSIESATIGQKVTDLSLSGADGIEISLAPGNTLRFAIQ